MTFEQEKNQNVIIVFFLFTLLLRHLFTVCLGSVTFSKEEEEEGVPRAEGWPKGEEKGVKEEE